MRQLHQNGIQFCKYSFYIRVALKDPRRKRKPYYINKRDSRELQKRGCTLFEWKSDLKG